TRDFGVQSALAKGALRPRSRFGAALQLLSDGMAHLIIHERRDLHLLTAFDVARVPVGLAADLDRYAPASALAEIMLHFAPAEPHPASFDTLRESLILLEQSPPEALEALGIRLIWQLVSSLGFEPSLEACVRDGSPVPAEGPLAFSTREGGALCSGCAAQLEATRLPADARAALAALVEPDADLVLLGGRDAAAHRRLAARFVRHHLGEGAALPALEFWERRAWIPA